MKKNIKISSILCFCLFIIICPLIVRADDNDYLSSNVLADYKSHTITCSYVYTSNQAVSGESGSQTIKITFKSAIIDGDTYMDSTNDEGWEGSKMEVWKLESVDAKDNLMNLSIGTDLNYNDLVYPNEYVIKPDGAFLYSANELQKMANDNVPPSEKYKANYNNCPSIVIDGHGDNKIYSVKYAESAMTSNGYVKLTKEEDAKNITDDSEGYDSEMKQAYSICSVGIPYTEGQTIINLKVRAYEDGQIKIALDATEEDDFKSIYPNDDVIWQSKSTELGKTVTIRKSEWDSIKSQIGYEECKKNPNITLTATTLKDKDSVGENIIGLGKDEISEEMGGMGSIGTGTGNVNIGSSDWSWELGGEISLNTSTCKQLLSNELINFIQNAWTIVKVLAILITIALGILDFVNAASKDKDILMESVNKTVKRLVLVIIILLIPTLIEIIGELFGIEDILCGIK